MFKKIGKVGHKEVEACMLAFENNRDQQFYMIVKTQSKS